MVSLVMLAIMVACVALLYLKGTLVQGITLVLNAFAAGFVAFGFFELLARFLVKYSPGIAVWAQMICFLLLFILVFAILQTVAMQLGKEKADLGLLPERIGRVICGIFLGYIVMGQLLVALALAPSAALNKYPYQRFEERNPNPTAATKPFLSPDGFVTGLFSTVSQGSFRAISKPQSFAVLHAGFLDQLYLNRHTLGEEVPLLTTSTAITVEKDNVWYAPDTLRDEEGKPVAAAAGESLMLVRVGIRKRSLRDASKFSLSQIRLVCGPKTGTEHPLGGSGQAVYPLGYVGTDRRLERKSLDEVITIDSGEVEGDALNIDMAFSVPMNMVPVLMQYKRNSVVQLSAPVSGEDAPEIIPFGGSAKPAKTESRPEGGDTSAVPGPEGQRNRRPLSDISRSIVGDQLDEQ